jgi:hypothetical protein
MVRNGTDRKTGRKNKLNPPHTGEKNSFCNPHTVLDPKRFGHQ